jgi:DNA ligase 1
MLLFAQTCEAVAGTTRKTEKVRLVADYLKAGGVAEAAVAALFLSGRVFPAHAETTLQVGGSLLWQALREVSGASDAALTSAYRKHGDLGAAAREILAKLELSASEKSGRAGQPQRPDPGDSAEKPRPPRLTLSDVAQRFRQIAKARGTTAKLMLVIELLAQAQPLEAKYLIKLMTGELRIGLRESLVEEAIAQAYDADLKSVQRANMLLGDISETLRLAADHRLEDARMRLFHPIGFMLASPAESAEEAFAEFQHAAVEDKYDGIRAQAHCGSGDDDQRRVRLFSRTLDDVTESFPELVPALEAFSGDVILDGEIVAWSADNPEAGRPGRALPFSDLQKRLGRKRVTAAMMRAVPVAYVAFDVLYTEGELVMDRPLRERGILLDAVFAGAREVKRALASDPQGNLVFEPEIESGDENVRQWEPHGRVLRAPVLRADSPQQLDELFDAAQARGNEGLMIKDVESSYTPGRRGRAWLKLKRELATLDVVVTAAEYGHGKRVGVLSDYTFAVRSGDRLLNIGKAYSGLTDLEIAELTQWFLVHTLEDRGFVRVVEPRIVLEVAFNAVMRSDRHDSGFALRFPRILRIRTDKLPEEIDTLERVEEIYQRQKLTQAGASSESGNRGIG